MELLRLWATAAPCRQGFRRRFSFACTGQRVRMTGLADAGDDLDPALRHAPKSQKAVGDVLQAVGPAAHDENLKAQIVVDVNVESGTHLFAQLMLKLGQPFAEIAHVVVVDQGQRADRVHRLAHLGPPDLCSGQISEQLGSRAPALPYQSIDLAQQRAFEGNTEPNQGILHPGETTTPWRGCGD